MGENADAPTPTYALGHSERELERLSAQARLIDPITRRFFLEAGIVPGMRVLDVGSGAGDVAFLLAELVGASGEVVGVDRSAVALATAKERAEGKSLRNVSFVEGDPAELECDTQFDAIAGRHVLQFQGDPSAMLRKVAKHARPGGVIVFHEIDWNPTPSFPAAPIYDEACGWIARTLELAGYAPRPGMRLHATFVDAGLGPPTMRLEAVIGGGENSAQAQLIAGVVRTLLPEMERLGVATPEEVGIETLADRMMSEALANGCVLIGRMEIGAWCRV